MNTGTCDGVSCTCYIHCNIRNQYTSALYLYVFKDLPPTPRYVRFLNELTCKSVILLSVTIMHIHWFYMCTVCLKRSMHPRFSGQKSQFVKISLTHSNFALIYGLLLPRSLLLLVKPFSWMYNIYKMLTRQNGQYVPVVFIVFLSISIYRFQIK